MSYYLGVDLGTTFTSAGVFRDGWVATAALSNHEPSTRSVVFVKEDGTILSGDTAARRGATDPERVGREFKRRLGDPQPLLLGGSPYSAEQLTSRLLKFVLDKVNTAEGEQPAGVAISHPANWGPYKIDLLRQAVQMAGLPDTTVYLPEPEAAAIFYAEDARLETDQTIAVYDLGGGTFDAAVLRKTDDGFTFLGKPVGIERLGGIDFDAAIFAHVSRVLGNQIAELDPNDPTALMAVARLREDCTTAREALSDDNTVTIPVVLPNGSTEVRLTRSEFEGMIRPGIGETIEALRRALDSAQVGPQDLHGVLLVGGCSRTPLVAELISSELGCRVVLCPDIIHAVALGGAHAAARAHQARDLPKAPDQHQAVAGPPAATAVPTQPGAVLGTGAGAGASTAPPRHQPPTPSATPQQAPIPARLDAGQPASDPSTPPTPQSQGPALSATLGGMPAPTAGPASNNPPPSASQPIPTPGYPAEVEMAPPKGQQTFDQLATTQENEAQPVGAAFAPTPTMVVLSEDTAEKRRRGALLAGAAGLALLLVGGGVYAATRGGDDADTATATAADANIAEAAPATDSAVSSQTSTIPDEPAVSSEKILVVSTVDQGSMAPINATNPTIGTNNETSSLSPPEFAPEAQFDGTVQAFVDRNVTTNIQFYDFATFTSAVSGDDPQMVWLELVPESWLETSSLRPTDFAELGLAPQEPVQGIGWDTADRYCSYALKRMPTEIEWELAAVAGSIDFSSTQNWVSDPEVYGSLPSGATVVRGTSGPENSSVYHRTISPSGDGVPNAGVRCAADEVNEIARPSGELLYSRIFGGEDEPRDWPDLHDPSNVNVVFGYHSPDVFHIELAEASTVAVSSAQIHGANTQVSMEVELRKPKEPSGWFRYGLLTRSTANAALTFMVHPQINADGQRELAWCVNRPGHSLVPSGQIYGIESSAYSACELEGVQPVENFRNNISIRFNAGTAEFLIEGAMVDSMAHELPQDGEFGVVSESFDDDPLTHIHYDNLVVKTS